MQDPVYVCKEWRWTSPHRICGIYVMLWSKFLVRRADTVDWGAINFCHYLVADVEGSI